MKLFNKLSAAIMSVALMAGFASCTETADYDAPSVPTNAQVHFSNADATTISLNAEQDSFAVKVYRAEAGAGLVVPLNIVSDSADVFTFPEEVVFEADSTVAYITVTFDFANIVPDTDYPVSIELLGDEVTPYGASKVSLVVKYAPWSEWKKVNTGTYTYTQFFSGEDPDRPVYTRRSLVNEAQQQFKIEGVMYGIDMLVEYNAATGLCTVGEHYTGYDHSSYGSVFCSDANVYTGSDFAPSVFDPETGLFSLYMVYYVSAGVFGHGYEYFQLDGYTKPDYSLKITENGHYVNLKGEDNALVYILKGADVDTYKYAIFQGALSNEELGAAINGIADGSVEATEVAESGYQLFPLKEAGEYTVVAVSFDKNAEAQDYGYLTFEFVPVGQSSPWESMGMATYREDLMTTIANVENLVYEVEIQVNTETPGLYRLVNPYGAAYPYNEEGDYDASKNYYMEIDASNPEQVTVGLSYTGLDWGKGELALWSLAGYYMANGKTAEEVAAAGYFGKLENGVITFPVNSLLISMPGIQDGALMYANTNGKFAVALPGYEIPEDEATEEGGEEEGGEEEGGEESSARIRRNDVEAFGKISLKGRPADANVIANYLQSNIR